MEKKIRKYNAKYIIMITPLSPCVWKMYDTSYGHANISIDIKSAAAVRYMYVK